MNMGNLARQTASQPVEHCPVPLNEWRRPLRLPARLVGPTLMRLATAYISDETSADEARRVAAGVARKINLMPVHMGLAILCFTGLFALNVRLRFRRSVATLSSDDLDRQIASWSCSNLPMLQDVMLLYQRLTNFLHYSRP